MIIEAKIIPQPQSGEYKERIYDIENVWNSQSWTFIRFTNSNYSDWCGQFRGYPRQVALSDVRNMVLVLTTDYLYQLDRKTGDVTEWENQPPYHQLTTSPQGDFLLADYYTLEKVTTSIKQKMLIESPFSMDLIRFKEWKGLKLEFTCEQFLSWGKTITLHYDSESGRIEPLTAG